MFGPPLLPDPSGDAVEYYLERIGVPEVWAATERALLAKLRRSSTLAVPPGQVLAKKRAQRYVRRCITVVERALQAECRRLSPAEWLWLLRRVPIELSAGSWPTNAGYRRTVAEVASQLVPGRRHRSAAGAGGWSHVPLERNVRRALRLVVAARFAAGLHATARWVGKGAAVEVDADRYPRLVEPPPNEAAVLEYDDRMRQDAPVLARLGTLVLTPGRHFPTSTRTIALCGRPGFVVPVPVPRRRSGPGAFVEGHFGFDRLDLGELVPLVEYLDDRTPEARETLGSLVAVLRWAYELLDGGHRATVDLVRRGYVVGGRDHLRPDLDDVLRRLKADTADLQGAGVAFPDDAAGVERRLRSPRGRLFPLRPGPPVRTRGPDVYVDVAGATELLNHLLSYARATGEVGNRRGTHFEQKVQPVVDATKWAPDPALRPFVGRWLRLNRKQVTNLDAVGRKGSTLLLVDAKSKAYTDELEEGAYGAVLNLCRDAERYAAAWQDKVARIRANPVGDNYDFSWATDVVGVVCTPFVAYTPYGPATQEVAPRLRAVSSVGELRAWLDR